MMFFLFKISQYDLNYVFTNDTSVNLDRNSVISPKLFSGEISFTTYTTCLHAYGMHEDTYHHLPTKLFYQSLADSYKFTSCATLADLQSASTAAFLYQLYFKHWCCMQL